MKPVADLHIHTVACTHALSTVNEICRTASERGLYAVAITDHGPEMPDGPHYWHFYGLYSMPRLLYGVRTLRGVEANVKDVSGTLDMDGHIPLDFVIVSMHHDLYTPKSVREHTETWINVARNPYADCIGHAGQPDFPFDYDAVCKACAETGTIFEINNGSFWSRRGSEPGCREILRACKRHGVSVAVTSDAHHDSKVGRFDEAVSMIKDEKFPPELVINASVDNLNAYFYRRKQLKLESFEE